jgi:ATP-binding cassette subfamily F protein 3
VNKTANKIWEIVDRKIRVFDGTYNEWEEWKKKVIDGKISANLPGSLPVGEPESPAEKPDSSSDIAAAGGKAINKEAKRAWEKQKKQFEQLEISLNKLRAEKSRLEAALADPGTYADKEKFLAAEKEYHEVSDQAEKLNAAYETAFEKMMELEAEIRG